MRIRAHLYDGGTDRFFYLTIRNSSSLKAYFDNLFTLIHDYKYSLSELENMIPWERDTYISLLNIWAKAEEDRIKSTRDQQNHQQRQILQQMNRKR